MPGASGAELPIDRQLPRIVSALEEHASCVVLAETGAGKTTRVPPALVASGLMGPGQRVLLLEPRRIAARAAARRIAAERGWSVGEEIGYQVRFDRRFRPSSRIVVVTEGVLLGWLQADPFLEGTAAVILDEFHERRLDSDLALALLRSVQREARPELRLLVMSATLDPQPVADYLGSCPVLRCPGRSFPVEVSYRPRPADEPLERATALGIRQVLEDGDGDILAFLPGAREIHRTARELEPFAGERDILLVPLYGSLPATEQDKALEPARRRKVVLATNVAESSVTLPGITAVVDSGYARSLRFDTACGLDRLELARISRASADQRAGRAGRLRPGRCLRLWSEHEQRGLPAFETPEVRRVDLSGAVLQLAAWGEPEAEAFPWFEAPAQEPLTRARNLLRRLGALGRRGITPLGRFLVSLPAQPRLARLLLEAHRLGILRLGALAAALLADRSPFRGARRTELALTGRLEALERFERSRRPAPGLDPAAARRTLRVRDQLISAFERRSRDLPPELEPSAAAPRPEEQGPHRRLLQALVVAYPDRLARKRTEDPRRGVLVGGRGVRLAQGCPTPATELFLCLDLDAGRRGDRSEALVRLTAEMEARWLPEDPLAESDEVEFDGERQRVVGFRRTRFEDLVIEERPAPPDPEAATRTLVEAAAEDLSKALALDDPAVESFLARLRWLRQAMPDLGLPAFSDDELTALLPSLAAGCRSFVQLRKVPLLAALQGTLTYEQLSALHRHAPERLLVPSGSHIRLDYLAGESPVLAVRIQELFGLPETPRLAGGRVPVLLHLLAPNFRPQQVTDDLASFWRTTYHQVRKELQGRYPKHHWPDDPLTASPRRRPGR